MPQPVRRLIITTIDDVARILKSYLPHDALPPSARPVTLLASPAHQGKLAVEFEDDSWDGDQGEAIADIELRRFHAVGQG